MQNKIKTINKGVCIEMERTEHNDMIYDYFHQLDIILTRECDKRCNFCRVSKTDEKLDIGSAIRFLDKYGEVKEIKLLKFLGGEPLLEWGNLKKILNRYNKKTNFDINTNGQFLNQEKINFLKEIDNCSLIISFDSEKWKIKEFLEKMESLDLTDLKNVYINLVICPKTIKKLMEEFPKLCRLKVNGFRLFPAFYVEWDKQEFLELSILLKRLYSLKKENINVESRCETYGNQMLMNNHLTIDADGGVYFSDAVLFDYFDNIKDRLKITSINDKDGLEKIELMDPDTIMKKFKILDREFSNIIKPTTLKTNLYLYKVFEYFENNY